MPLPIDHLNSRSRQDSNLHPLVGQTKYPPPTPPTEFKNVGTYLLGPLLLPTPRTQHCCSLDNYPREQAKTERFSNVSRSNCLLHHSGITSLSLKCAGFKRRRHLLEIDEIRPATGQTLTEPSQPKHRIGFDAVHRAFLLRS